MISKYLIKPFIVGLIYCSSTVSILTVPDSIHFNTRLRAAYQSKEQFIHFMENDFLPLLIKLNPSTTTLFKSYKEAWQAKDAIAIKTIEAQIEAEIDQFNAHIVQCLGLYNDEIGALDTTQLQPASESIIKETYSSKEIQEIQDSILKGELALEVFAAGAATRLGLGSMFGMSLNSFYDVVSKKNTAGKYEINIDKLCAGAREDISNLAKAAIEKHPEFAEFPMGARILYQFRLEIESIIKKLNPQLFEEELKAKIDQALALQKISLLINAEIIEEVESILRMYNFFGFGRENIFITVQPTFKGYTLTTDDEGSQAQYDETCSRELVNGHGHPSMQKFYPNQSYILDQNNNRKYLSKALATELYERGAKLLAIVRINDISKYEPTHALDVATLLEAVYALGGFHNLDSSIGADIAIEATENPSKQKGGLIVSTPQIAAQGYAIMTDTLSSKSEDWQCAFKRIEETLGDGIPYNAMRQVYKLASLQKDAKGIMPYLRLREFEPDQPKLIAAETVTGDLTFFLKARIIKKPGRSVRDFKEASQMNSIIKAFSDQNDFFGSLGLTPDTMCCIH